MCSLSLCALSMIFLHWNRTLSLAHLLSGKLIKNKLIWEHATCKHDVELLIKCRFWQSVLWLGYKKGPNCRSYHVRWLCCSHAYSQTTITLLKLPQTSWDHWPWTWGPVGGWGPYLNNLGPNFGMDILIPSESSNCSNVLNYKYSKFIISEFFCLFVFLQHCLMHLIPLGHNLLQLKPLCNETTTVYFF